MFILVDFLIHAAVVVLCLCGFFKAEKDGDG